MPANYEEPSSQAPCQGERVRKPTQPHSSNQTATEEPSVLARERETCLGRNGTDGTDWL